MNFSSKAPPFFAQFFRDLLLKIALHCLIHIDFPVWTLPVNLKLVSLREIKEQ